MDEAPRHKKKATRGKFPVYYRIDKSRHPESYRFFQWAREWSVHGWYKDKKTADRACAVLNRKAQIYEYSTEARDVEQNDC